MKQRFGATLLQRNHFFLIADMYLGQSDPLDEALQDDALCEEIPEFSTPWTFDFGFDKTDDFEQHAKGPTLHWNDQIQQTKSISQWLDLTQSNGSL
jgi:hypothetical protein